jgi:hypothetical protein
MHGLAVDGGGGEPGRFQNEADILLRNRFFRECPAGVTVLGTGKETV